MIIYDFRCDDCGHVFDDLVPSGVKDVECPECHNNARQVWLKPPKLDWAGMAQGANAGPEFIDRFERSHKQRAEQETKYKQEHGDSMSLAGS